MDSVALAYAPLLRHLKDNGGEPSMQALADAVGKDRANLRRDIPRIAEAGYLEVDDHRPSAPKLTAKAERFLQALDLADGRLHMPENFVGARHGEIAPHPLNPRKTFDPQALEELKGDIVQTGYVIQNLMLRPADPQGQVKPPAGVRFWIVAGERRWRAVGLAIAEGAWDPAAQLLPAQLRDMDDAAHLRIALAENLQRVDLNPIEEAEVYDGLIAAGAETSKSLAERLNKTDRYIDRRRQLLKVPPITRAALIARKITIEEALKTVQTPKDPPTAPASPEEQREANRRAWEAQRRDRIRTACAELKALQLLVHVEIADKVHFQPAGERAGSATCQDNYPDPMHSHTSLMSTGCGFLSHNGKQWVQISDVAIEWLEEQGLLTSVGDRGAILARARALAGRAPKEGQFYVTPWLNPRPVITTSAGAEDTKPTFQSDFYRQIKDAQDDGEAKAAELPGLEPTAEEQQARAERAKGEREEAWDTDAVQQLVPYALERRERFRAAWSGDAEPLDHLAFALAASLKNGSLAYVVLAAAALLKRAPRDGVADLLRAAFAEVVDQARAADRQALFDLREGDQVSVGGDATTHRLIRRLQDSPERGAVFEAQPMRRGKDYGRPGQIALAQIQRVAVRAPSVAEAAA